MKTLLDILGAGVLIGSLTLACFHVASAPRPEPLAVPRQKSYCGKQSCDCGCNAGETCRCADHKE